MRLLSIYYTMTLGGFYLVNDISFFTIDVDMHMDIVNKSSICFSPGIYRYFF